jgi:hypothetical protein
MHRSVSIKQCSQESSHPVFPGVFRTTTLKGAAMLPNDQQPCPENCFFAGSLDWGRHSPQPLHGSSGPLAPTLRSVL